MHDINNLTDEKRKRDHQYSDILGQSGLDYKLKSPARYTPIEDQGDVKTRSGTENHDAKGIK